MYDLLAPHYRNYASEKGNYINAVDKAILRELKPSMKTMLDIGSGDGIRAVNLAKQAGIEKLILSEPSEKMVELCRQVYSGEIWNVTAENLKSNGQRFDLITCLWNVLGHIPDTSRRINSLRKIRDFLQPGSVLFMDVNNRYNARAYGKAEIFKRVIFDLFHPGNNKGDTEYELKIDGTSITGMGHLFTPQEIRMLVKSSGFRIKKRISVDYKNGSIHSSVFNGQLLYILEKVGS